MTSFLHGPMKGQSRAALARAQERTEAAVAGSAAAPVALAQELFAVAGVLSSTAGLRRALADSSRPAAGRAALAGRLLTDRVGAQALAIVQAVVSDTWSDSADLPDAIEQLGVLAVLSGAERAGTVDALEDELFRFSRTLAGHTGLRDAFAARTSGAARKVALVDQLLTGKVSEHTLVLARQAATATSDRRTEQVLQDYLALAADRRRQLVAEVTSATELSAAQRTRLGEALHRLYGRPVRVNLRVEPDVLGGIRIEVGGELLDGTTVSRLHAARQALSR